MNKKGSKKLKSIKTLQNKALRLVRDAAFKLYGKYCHVQKIYPKIKLNHTEVIQGDHVITRANKYFIYDVKNILPVCSGCNSAKSNHLRSIERAINDIVRCRDVEWYDNAVWLDKSGECNHAWKQRWWLEEQIQNLTEILNA